MAVVGRTGLLLLCSVYPGVRETVADLNILAIGDWGGLSDAEPTTKEQRLTAIGLRRAAQDLDADFTLLMGDNFYERGVNTDFSRRFQETFEDVYPALIKGRPFYAMAGNHDYGNGAVANISAQIAYTQHSTSWRYPALWYKIHRGFEAGGQARTLDVLVLDTIVLCGHKEGDEEYINEQLQEQLGFIGGRKTPAEERRSLREIAAEAQWTWLERELASSKADFLWVTGHYPIWSAAKFGPQQCLLDRLRPLLVAHGAHYISGHDHVLEHFEHRGLNTFVVGAGMQCCFDASNMWQVPPDATRYILAGEGGAQSRPPAPFHVHGGFASLRFGAESAVVSLHAHNSTILYAAQPIPRRSSTGGSPDAPAQKAPRAMEHPAGIALLFALLFGATLAAHGAFALWQERSGAPRGYQKAAAPLLRAK